MVCPHKYMGSPGTLSDTCVPRLELRSIRRFHIINRRARINLSITSITRPPETHDTYRIPVVRRRPACQIRAGLPDKDARESTLDDGRIPRLVRRDLVLGCEHAKLFH